MLGVKQRDITTHHLVFIKYFLSIYRAQTVGDKKLFTTGSLASRGSVVEMIK